MITLINELPKFQNATAEMIKINCLFDNYKNDNSVLFWAQDNNKCVISMTDGNMIIHNNNAETDELHEFLNVLNPVCVFSDMNTLLSLGLTPDENINVVCRKADVPAFMPSDQLSSSELYTLLDVEGLSLPEYPYFAVDYCRRLNNGFANYFALKDKCAVITFNSGENSIINGLASHEKGYGSIALKGALHKNNGKMLYACCRDKILPFYLKNGFQKLYNAGYWVKNK
jgi:hypothetical protein